ncbi:MAG: ABC transporter ATP-binding protein [Microbacteriaceae bacterium]
MPADLSALGASIDLKGLTKRYGDVIAVDSIDLEAKPGEFLTLLGPSGSGKTTTLNMIAGFESITGGELLIDGRPVNALPPYKRNIGMVFQHYALFPHMSAGENIEYPLRQRKIPKAERARLVEQALNTVGLDKLGRRMPRQLSGGQQQRVALARAMVYSPRVLLMDEPLGALDKKLRDALQLEIKSIHEKLGTTFVYVTHDQDEALVLSNRVAVFNKGKIEQVASPHELYERPATVFVAQFLGESSLFRGTAVLGSGAPAVRTAAGTMLYGGRSEALDGEAATLVVRPERIRVTSVREPQPDGNWARGWVRQEIYLGNSRKLEIELIDGSRVFARESAGSVSACVSGDEVWLAFRDQDAAVLADSPGVDLNNLETKTAAISVAG